MDAKTLLGDGDGKNEVRGLAEPLRAAVESRVQDGEVHLAMGGDAAAIVATDCCVWHLAVTRTPEPKVRRAEYTEIALVEGRVDHGRAELSVRLVDGSSMLVHAPVDRGEQAMQAATVLNLLVIEARRHVSPGRGLRDSRDSRQQRVPPSRRADSRLPAGLRPRR